MVLQSFFLRVMSCLAGGPQRQRGQTLAEYSMIIGLIAMVAIAGLTAFQVSVDQVYDKVKLAADAMIGALA